MSVATQDRRLTIPRTRSATLTAGVFDDLDNLLAALKSLRSVALAATEDIVGLAVPVQGDPSAPDALYTVPLPLPKARRFDVMRWLMDVVDPHPPAPAYGALIQGQNSPLARPLLGSLSKWLVAVQPWRVPVEGIPDSGVWVVGRPNHAAALAGAKGAAAGGTWGALAALGLDEETSLRFAKRLPEGHSILTTCETDEGRAKRDLRLFKKHGAQDVVQRPIVQAQHERA